MNIKFVLMSIIVLGLIVNTSSFSDFAFAEKPDKNKDKGNSDKGIEAQGNSDNGKGKGNEVQEFGENGVVTSSSSTICHIPPGNPLNNHTLHVGPAAVNAHVNNHGDAEMACENVDWSEFLYKFDDQEFESNKNLVEQISQQIEELQQRLQQLLGL